MSFPFNDHRIPDAKDILRDLNSEHSARWHRTESEGMLEAKRAEWRQQESIKHIKKTDNITGEAISHSAPSPHEMLVKIRKEDAEFWEQESEDRKERSKQRRMEMHKTRPDLYTADGELTVQNHLLILAGLRRRFNPHEADVLEEIAQKYAKKK